MRPEPLLPVLDEPTASPDAQTEYERYADAAREAGARTGTITLLVTHRFSTVRMADTIVVLGDAGVQEVGSHNELMKRGGMYAE